MVFDSSIVLKAKGMIVSTVSGYAIQTSFEGLGAEIANRSDSLKIIEKNTKRSYRRKLSVDRWLPLVKKIRHILTHREHENIVFATSKEGLLFQIYDNEMQASIVIPEVLYVSGKNVIDFELYSAFILSELFVLIDNLGYVIANKLDLSHKDFSKMSGS